MFLGSGPCTNSEIARDVNVCVRAERHENISVTNTYAQMFWFYLYAQSTMDTTIIKIFIKKYHTHKREDMHEHWITNTLTMKDSLVFDSNNNIHMVRLRTYRPTHTHSYSVIQHTPTDLGKQSDNNKQNIENFHTQIGKKYILLRHLKTFTLEISTIRSARQWTQ